MAWTIELSAPARKQLRKLDRQNARRITDFLGTKLAEVNDPRSMGKPLHAAPDSYWGYRVGDYRLVCELKDRVLTVLVVKIGHRSDVYR